jgi:hypothetical protein
LHLLIFCEREKASRVAGSSRWLVIRPASAYGQPHLIKVEGFHAAKSI